MRLPGIGSMAAANAFLPTFLKDFNTRFAIAARHSQDAHRDLLHSEQELDLIPARHTTRHISKDPEVQYNNCLYQIQSNSPCYTMRRAQVAVGEAVDGQVTLLYKGRELAYKRLSKDQKRRPKADQKTLNKAVDKAVKQRTAHKPKANHPWRTTPISSRSTPTLPAEHPG